MLMLMTAGYSGFPASIRFADSYEEELLDAAFMFRFIYSGQGSKKGEPQKRKPLRRGKDYPPKLEP